MANIYEYGSVKSIPFKLTKNGVAVTGLVYGTTLAFDDVQICIDSAPFVNANTLGGITELGLGWYKWTPANGTIMTITDIFIMNIADAVGDVFDENGDVETVGGNDLARLHG